MRWIIAVPAPRVPDADEAGRGEMPELPALTGLLRRSRRLPATDWRPGVMQALGVADQEPLAIAAQGTTMSPGVSGCFVSPLHVIAGMSRVHLPPGGQVRLGVEESRAWCEAFNAQFAADGIVLHETLPGAQWLLQASFAQAARDAEPAALVGETLERNVAVGADEKALRRLGAEVEMWLSSHALNRAREKRGDPVLNAFWFWGGGRASTVPALSWRGRVVSNTQPDAWLAGLARLAGTTVSRVPAGDASLLTAPRELLAVLDESGEGSGWQALELQWFQPVLQALQSRRLESLRLQIGNTAWEGPDRSALRWLRRGRGAWWQLLQAARA